jgi:hypothetical protein
VSGGCGAGGSGGCAQGHAPEMTNPRALATGDHLFFMFV